MTAASSKLAEQWKNQDEKDKKVWEKKAQTDIKRYQKQLADLLSKGFFIMEDGSKSSEFKIALKKKKSQVTQPKEDAPN